MVTYLVIKKVCKGHGKWSDFKLLMKHKKGMIQRGTESMVTFICSLHIANYAQTECQFRYCGTAIPFLTVRSTAR